MARIFHRKGLQAVRSRGFSLIEIMVAVVVLATGLLALAALQGVISRNSADSKARGAVMAALTSRMNEIRNPPPADGTTTFTCSGGNWVCTAQTMGSIGSLTVTQAVSSFVWKAGAFSAYANGDDLTKGYFKRIGLSAAWTDASGAGKTLALRSNVSAKVYGTGDGYPTNDPSGSASKFPIVRQDNPSNTAGVIPIVTGNQATAASNPQPIIEGANDNLRVGTSFDVLNYVPEGSVAKITKRFQTEVIKCRCQYGAAGYSVAGKAQWPTVWNGATYSVYNGTGSPEGVTANAGEDTDYSGNSNGNGNKSSRLQSEQCTECCRDHHDNAGAALEARYDPEASATGKFNESNGVLTAVSSGKYVAACRVVKVDGLWRTTADMYQRQYGLLETTSVGGVQAKSGIPNSTSTTAYQTYVKDYLKLYTGSSTTAPSGAQSMFDDSARGLNLPTSIAIATASTSDYRYLHGRGLYVDYLTSKAQQAVGKAITNCPVGTDLAECILPVLPFTTINLTEMAKWTATNTTVLNVNTTKSLNFNVTEPSGGRTAGIASGTASNNSVMRTSNSGVAVSDDILGAVDSNGDGTTFSDSQSFQVGGGGPGPGTGDVFAVSLSGGGSNPFLQFLIGIDNGNCTYTGSNWSCPTNSVLPAAGTLTLTNYNQETTIPYTLNLSSQCTYVGNGNFNSPGTLTVQRPAFTNFGVNAVTNGGTALWLVTANTGKTTEVTTITLTAIPKAATATIGVTLTADSAQQLATVASCTYDKGQGNAAVLKTITWTKSWL